MSEDLNKKVEERVQERIVELTSSVLTYEIRHGFERIGNKLSPEVMITLRGGNINDTHLLARNIEIMIIEESKRQAANV